MKVLKKAGLLNHKIDTKIIEIHFGLKTFEALHAVGEIDKLSTEVELMSIQLKEQRSNKSLF